MLTINKIKCNKEVADYVKKEYKANKECWWGTFKETLQEFADNDYMLISRKELEDIYNSKNCSFKKYFEKEIKKNNEILAKFKDHYEYFYFERTFEEFLEYHVLADNGDGYFLISA